MKLEVGGQSFQTKAISPTWHLMKYAKAQQVGYQAGKDYKAAEAAGDDEAKAKAEEDWEQANSQLLVIQYNLIMRLLKADERARFEAFMDEADLEPNELEEALGNAISQLDGGEENERPKVEPLSSSDIVQQIPPKSRVVSFSRGTILDDPGEISSTG